MSKLRSSWLALALCAGLFGSAGARAEDDEALGFERTPPRLSFLDGEVSYFRPGADDWTTAVVNTALAPGDELATGAGANLELQVGAHGFARAGENTQLALTSLEPDFQQLRVTSGHVSLDLRSLQSGQTFEVDTPNSAFTIDRAGYYRVAVEGAATTFISRRGGRASLTPAAGESLAIAANEQVVVTGEDTPQVETYAAPELDAWDRWNYARTDEQQGSVSARYVPSGVYGTSDLDRYGDWRVVPSYGSLWVPRGVAAGWAPYSTGRWVYDPYYGWTWVDDYAWGWAPYHYGRWVHYSGYWGWCPGPIVARPYYSPALVAFYGGGFSVGVNFGVPYVGWVALGWGEPLIPWWGSARFRHYPHWAGWGGPRFVNNVAFHHKTVYNIHQINVYRNAGVRNAIVAVDRDHFGRRWHDGSGSGRRGGSDGRDGSRFTRVRDDQRDQLRPLHGDPGVRPDRSSLVADARSGRRPSREDRQRSVVATRQPRFDAVPGLDTSRGVRDGRGRDGRAGAEAGAPDGLPAARLVEPSHEARRNQVSSRQSFGAQGDGERRVARPEPRFQQRETAAQASPPATRDDARERGPRAERSRTEAPSARAWQSAPTRDQAERARGATPDRAEPQRTPRPERNFARPEPPAQRAERARPERSDSSRRREQATAPQRQLPGEPANRQFQPRGQRAERAPRQERIERAGREPRAERSAPAPQRERPARQPQWQRPAREPQMQARIEAPARSARPPQDQWSQRGNQAAPAGQPQLQARAQGGGERSGEVHSRGGNGGGGGGRRGGDPQAAGDGGGSSWNGGGGNAGGGGWNGGSGQGGGGGGRGGGYFGGGGQGSRGR